MAPPAEAGGAQHTDLGVSPKTFGMDPHKAIPIQCVHCSVRLALEVEAWGTDADIVDQEIVCPICKGGQEISTHGTVKSITRWVNPRRRLE